MGLLTNSEVATCLVHVRLIIITYRRNTLVAIPGRSLQSMKLQSQHRFQFLSMLFSPCKKYPYLFYTWLVHTQHAYCFRVPCNTYNTSRLHIVNPAIQVTFQPRPYHLIFNCTWIHKAIKTIDGA